MASIRIPFLVGKTNKAGLTSWYWQPSATLAKRGWRSVPLGKGGARDNPPQDIVDACRKQSAKAEEAASATVRQVRRIARPITVGELIDAFVKAGYPSVKRRGTLLAPASADQARSKHVILRRWAEDGRTPCIAITAERVRKLRDALLAPAAGGRRAGEVRQRSAQETMNIGLALFKWGEQEGLLPKGCNPFIDHGIAAPPPREQIWSDLARKAVIDAAEKDGEPNLALAVDLAFQTAQRRADLVKLPIGRFLAIADYKVGDPDLYARLCAIEVPAIGKPGQPGYRPASIPGDVRGISLRQSKGGRWVEMPVVGETRARIEAEIARAKARGFTTLLFDEQAGTPWTSPNVKAGLTRFTRRFAELRDTAIAAARKAGDEPLAAELEQLQYRDFRRTAVVHHGQLGLADQLVSAITGHSLDTTKKILETYMPRTTGMAARAIALSHERSAPQSGTLRREGEKG